MLSPHICLRVDLLAREARAGTGRLRLLPRQLLRFFLGCLWTIFINLCLSSINQVSHLAIALAALGRRVLQLGRINFLPGRRSSMNESLIQVFLQLRQVPHVLW